MEITPQAQRDADLRTQIVIMGAYARRVWRKCAACMEGNCPALRESLYIEAAAQECERILNQQEGK